jgi:hypothetical protein
VNVHFVLPGEAALEPLLALDPDLDWRQFMTGERAWILQTYLRLRGVCQRLRLVSRLPDEGIAIFSAKHRRHLLSAHRFARPGALLVAVREDVGRTPFADCELVQNPSQACDGNTIHMPLWPQPGLLARDEARGDALRAVAFKGYVENLHPSFRQPEWRAFLESRGLEWQLDAVPFARTPSGNHQVSWNNFRSTDLVVAVRPHDDSLHPRKPATKLYNAWLAGAPALIGPELACRALRRDDLDYIEVRDCAEAMRAIDGILANRERYRALVGRARQRAPEFSVATIVDRWRALIEQELPRRAEGARGRRPLWLRQALGRISRGDERHARGQLPAEP